LALRVEVARALHGGPPAAFVRSAVLACALLREVAARLPEGSSTLAMRLTGDRELRRLNRTFLGEDAVTDVLSFPSEASPAHFQGGHLGDVAVSLPAARRQAASYGHSEEAEVALLCVHGFLHVLGWDHATPAEAEEMNRLTLQALSSLGLWVAPERLAT
jgi:probable rRNA maturation factor